MLAEQLENAIKLAIRRSPFAPALRKVFRKKLLAPANARGLISGWDDAATWLLSEPGRPVLQEPRFHAAMREGINTDIQTEFLLSALRRQLLLADRTLLAHETVQETLYTLIQQCVNNEYVWSATSEEQHAVAANLKIIAASDPNQKAPWPVLMLTAMYFRLSTLLSPGESKNDFLDRFEVIPEKLRNFVDVYLSNFMEEMSIKQSLKRFADISNTTSKQIADNYEGYPYPRWVDLQVPEAGKRYERLKEFFADSELTFTQRPFNVLVAGCGTGNKAIEYALSYGRQARILAIDLSRTSLAYAARMAKRYRADNIEFMQMDLLDLPKLDRWFDIVECTGVLHHMKDPTEGGRAVISRVRKEGIVHISLYSELARREIVALRKRYEDRIGQINDEEVRALRQKLMHNNPELIDDRLSLRWDFFDMNRCRDLLFHPLEHRFSVPKIAQMLNTLDLEFRGFEPPDLILTQYWTPYPSKKDQRNLERWQAFEENNPDSFCNLYEIWAKKLND